MANNNVNINVTATVQSAIATLNSFQQQMNRAASSMAGSFNAANAAIGRAGTNASNMFSRMASNIRGADLEVRRINANIIALGFAFVGASKQAGDFFDRAVQMENFRTRLSTLEGGVNKATGSIDKIFALSERVPFNLEAITEGFVRLKAAGIDPITNASGDGPLKTMLDAISSFGGDSDVMKRALLALSQMAGKGVVSMEELRQQLGEAMPTALRIAAKAMGMTVGEFVDQVSKGKVTFDEFFEPFIKGVEAVYGGNSEKFINNFQGSIAQLDTALSRLADTLLNQTGHMSKFTSLVQIATGYVNDFRRWIETPVGQMWVDDMFTKFEALVVKVAEGLGPLQNMVEIIGNLAGAVAQVTSSLPSEVVGGGILGYVLFGRAGLVPGALFGAYSEQLAQASGATGAFVSTVQGLFEGIMGSDAASSALIGGIIGFYTFGPTGALAGAAVGAMMAAQEQVAQFVLRVMGHMGVLREFMMDLFDPSKFFTELPSYDELFNRSMERNADAIKKLNEYFYGDGGMLDGSILDQGAGGKGDLEGRLNDAGNAIEKVGRQAQQNADAVTSFFDAVNQNAEKIRASKDTDIMSPISENVRRELESVKVSFGEMGDVVYQNQREALEKILEYGTTVTQQIAEADAKINEYMASGDMESQQKWEQQRIRLSELGRTIQEEAKRIGSTKMDNLAESFDAINNKVLEFSGNIPDTFEKQAALQKQLADLRTEIDKYSETLDSANLTEEQRAEMVQHLTQLENEYAAAQKLVSEKIDEKPWEKETAAKKKSAAASDELTRAQARSNDAAAQAASRIADLNEQVNSMIGNAGIDSEAAEVQKKTDEIASLMAKIQQEITKIQGLASRGVLPADVAEQDIAKLEAIRAKLEQNQGQIVSSVTAAGQAWQGFMSDITSSMESSLSDAIYGLVTGTKSAEDVLLDFFNSITRAASDYISKLIIAGLFGGGGGTGGGLLGGLLGFASGGSFMVDGRGGVDQNIVAFKASKGEKVTVQTKEQQQYGMGGGDTFVIQALDAKSVAELFMRHGSALQSSLDQRRRLNHKGMT